MKFYKKSQVTGRHIILMLLLILAALIAVLVITGQWKSTMDFYMDKLFR